MGMSDLERTLLFLMKTEKLPTPEQEVQVVPDRKFRFDFAYPEQRVAVEVEGITKFGPAIGRHQSFDGFTKDCEKYNIAALNGWLVIRVTRQHIESLKAIEWIRDALELRAAA